MPKVAICYWGICRSTNYTIDSIKTNVYDVLNENNIKYDVFLHTFKINREYKNGRSGEPTMQLNNELYTILNANYLEVEDQDIVDTKLDLPAYRTHGDPWFIPVNPSINFESFDNHIRALYSLYKVTKMYELRKSEYDAVIFMRPDMKYLHKINPAWLTIKDNLILTPDFHQDLPMNDRFAIAKERAALKYGLRYLDALEYSKQRPLHSEYFLYNILKRENLEIIDIPFRFRRIRATGQEVDLWIKAPS